MGRFNNVTRNAHAKAFIQAVFADRLLAEGFRCPDEKLLCWYRVVNKEIVNSICFYTVWSSMPLMVSIGYGIHPLFTLPARIPSVYAPDRPTDAETFCNQPLLPDPDIGHCHMNMYSADAQVYAPEGGFGIYTLDGVLLPIMDKVQTIEDCYLMHKQNLLNQEFGSVENRLGAASITFMDEAIYCNDTEVFPCFAPFLDQRIRFYENERISHPTSKSLRAALQHVMMQKHALYEGGRDEYLAYLQQQRMANIAQLKKKYGIIME